MTHNLFCILAYRGSLPDMARTCKNEHNRCAQLSTKFDADCIALRRKGTCIFSFGGGIASIKMCHQVFWHILAGPWRENMRDPHGDTSKSYAIFFSNEHLRSAIRIICLASWRRFAATSRRFSRASWKAAANMAAGIVTKAQAKNKEPHFHLAWELHWCDVSEEVSSVVREFVSHSSTCFTNLIIYFQGLNKKYSVMDRS